MASLVIYLSILSLGLNLRYRSSTWAKIELVEPLLPS